MILYTTLDATRTPIIDTSSIDAAAMKVASLGAAMDGFGSAMGGGGGGAGVDGGGAAESALLAA